MEGRGGCCIARYAGGVYDMSKVDRIMLRFRPIAPKPAASGSGSPKDNTELFSKSGRGKRRYSKESNNNNNKNNINSSKRCNRKRRVVSEEKRDIMMGRDSVVTLPLLPETPDGKDFPSRGSPEESPKHAKLEKTVPMWLSFGRYQADQHQALYGGSADRAAGIMAAQVVTMVGSCVTVECVTDTWVDEDALGSTDEQKRANLERDTCPGFISDGLGRVTWTNGAYRKMVTGQVADGEAADMMVWLVMKERPMLTYAAFTCRVRVQYTCGKERSSLTLPCDVWRTNGGGFAWRLDTKAALCLGR